MEKILNEKGDVIGFIRPKTDFKWFEDLIKYKEVKEFEEIKDEK